MAGCGGSGHPAQVSGTTVVPRVVGLPLTQALTRLSGGGLCASRVTVVPDSGAGSYADHVSRQTPTAGTRVNDGARVSLVDAVGPAVNSVVTQGHLGPGCTAPDIRFARQP